MTAPTLPVKKGNITLSKDQLRVSKVAAKKPLKPVPVVIRVVNGAISVGTAGKKVKVHRTQEDEVQWICKDGLFVVHFSKNGCPFDSVMFASPKNQAIGSGPCSAGALKGSYHYAIWVWADPAGPPLYLDPIVDVEDGGMIREAPPEY